MLKPMFADQSYSKTIPVFNPQRNCWRLSHLQHGEVLVDCADFYRAIHHAISGARRSIFILGWELDSTIRLLRGEDEKKAVLPSVVLDLLKFKAQENKDLNIYLLRWDSSIAFIGERELMPEYVWSAQTPDNVHICLDDTIPLGGSQHQKIILVDDEIVFTGGMDIARQRWDERAHRLYEPERTDAAGPYGPYHDVQIMMDGPVVDDFALIARWRWQRAAGYEAAPPSPTNCKNSNAHVKPGPLWPSRFPPLLTDMDCAISRTIPRMDDTEEITEIRQMYLDLIGTAKEFIYIENQFLTSNEIAQALNQRLHEKPGLRVLCISSYDPQGVMEREGMWAGRIDFKKTLEQGIELARVRILCSGMTDSQGQAHYKRIHSKVIVIDDTYLTVGSANINNRSMTLDTECDLQVMATTPEQARWIRQIRNDLIAEHSGLPMANIENLIRSGQGLDCFIRPASQNFYSLRPIDDTQFTSQSLQAVAQKLADPAEPLITGVEPLRNPRRGLILILVATVALAVGVLAFAGRALGEVNADQLRLFLESSRSSVWGLPMVCLLYVVGGFVLFPVTVLSVVTAAVFGSVLGPIYGLMGALCSAVLMFFIGRWAGVKGLRRLIGGRVRKIDHHFQKVGIWGVMVLRMIPIAPFTLVNMAAGVSSVRFIDFLLGSFLGFLPAFIAKGLVGDSLTQVLLNPSRQATVYLMAGLLLWIALVVISYVLAKRWSKGQNA